MSRDIQLKYMFYFFSSSISQLSKKHLQIQLQLLSYNSLQQFTGISTTLPVSVFNLQMVLIECSGSSFSNIVVQQQDRPLGPFPADAGLRLFVHTVCHAMPNEGECSQSLLNYTSVTTAARHRHYKSHIMYVENKMECGGKTTTIRRSKMPHTLCRKTPTMRGIMYFLFVYLYIFKYTKM